MYQELLDRYGRSDWRVAEDPVAEGACALYDDQNCIRAVVARDDDSSWRVRVVFLERVQSYYGCETEAAALESALHRLRGEEAYVP